MHTLWNVNKISSDWWQVGTPCCRIAPSQHILKFLFDNRGYSIILDSKIGHFWNPLFPLLDSTRNSRKRLDWVLALYTINLDNGSTNIKVVAS